MYYRKYKACCLLVIAILAGGGIAKAQYYGSFTRDMLFARHLHDKELYAEAVYVLNHIPADSLLQQQKDSLHFWQGWTAYATKSLKLAANRLLLVSDSVAWAKKSHFFAAYCLTFERDTMEAYRVLQAMQLNDSIEKEMQYFQMAGISLLQRNYKQYTALRNKFSFSSYIMEAEEKRMDEYYQKLYQYKKKSPLLAGIYSAVIPGAGKIYAGKKSQGIGAFFPVLSLAALTWEAYNKGGVKSARFITFGSLFSLFYAGNIWGSIVAVKVKQRERNNFYDNKILFDMHIPLRNLYN